MCNNTQLTARAAIVEVLSNATAFPSGESFTSSDVVYIIMNHVNKDIIDSVEDFRHSIRAVLEELVKQKCSIGRPYDVNRNSQPYTYTFL